MEIRHCCIPRSKHSPGARSLSLRVGLVMLHYSWPAETLQHHLRTVKKQQPSQARKITISTFLTSRESEYFTSWLCCCLQLRQCNMTTKLILPAPQAGSQCSSAGHVSLDSSREAHQPCPGQSRNRLAEPPTASLQVRAQSSQHQRCLSSRLRGTAIAPQIWMSSVG